MKVILEGIIVEGTPQEVVEFKELLSQNSKEDLNKNNTIHTTYIKLGDVYAEIDSRIQKIEDKISKLNENKLNN